MTSKVLKLGTYAITILLALALAVLCGVIVWLATGARDVQFLTPMVLSHLTPPGQEVTMGVETALLHIDVRESDLLLDIRNLRIKGPQGESFFAFPRAAVGVSPLSLLTPAPRFTRLLLYEPYIRVQHSKEGLSFGLGDAEEAPSQMPAMLAGMLGFGGEEAARVPRLDRLVILDAFIELRDTEHGLSWKIPRADVQLLRTDEGAEGSVDARLEGRAGEGASTQADVTIHVKLLREKALAELRFAFHEVYPSLFADFLPALEPLRALSLPVSGWVDTNLAFGGAIELVDFHLQGGPGTLEMAQWFEKPLEVAKFEIKGNVSDNLHTVLLDTLTLNFGGPELTIKGLIGLETAGLSLDADAAVTNLPADDLKLYWPTFLAPPSRLWVTQHITGGMVTRAGAKLLANPGELESGKVPPRLVNATIEVEGARVAYLEDMPPVEGVNGTVAFSDNGMHIRVHAGHAGEAVVEPDSTVVIPDLTQEPPELQIRLGVTAPAAEVVRHLNTPAFPFHKTLNLDPAIVTGEATGKVNLAFQIGHEGFVANAEKPFHGIQFAIEGVVKGFSAPGLLGAFDVDNAEGTLSLNNTALNYEGSLGLFAIPATLKLTQYFYPENDLDTHLEASMRVRHDQLPSLGIAPPSMLSGEMGVQAAMDIRRGTRFLNVQADITQAVMDLPSFSYHKASGVAGTLAFKAKMPPGKNTEIPEFHLAADGFDASGSMALNGKDGTLAALNVKRARFGDNDFTVAMSQAVGQDGKPVLEARLSGSSLNLTKMYKEEDFFTTGFNLPHMRVSADVAKIILGQDRELFDFSGSASCAADRCTAMKAQARFANRHTLNYRLAIEEDGKRRIRMTSDDAGEFARVLGIAKNVREGTLDVSGVFDDAKPNHPLDGKILVTKFRTTKAALLTKLLNLASLGGIVELLEGKGINFEKMSVPFHLENGVFYIKDAKSSGDSLGIIAEGTIDTNSKQVDIEGTLVPSYALNSLLSNVPIVGNILLGGKGQGLFAAKFHAKGPYNDAQISVNPLSMLTPGFLRHLFDIGDSGPAQAPPASAPAPSVDPAPPSSPTTQTAPVSPVQTAPATP